MYVCVCVHECSCKCVCTRAKFDASLDLVIACCCGVCSVIQYVDCVRTHLWLCMLVMMLVGGYDAGFMLCVCVCVCVVVVRVCLLVCCHMLVTAFTRFG